jgi:hypothetical protein
VIGGKNEAFPALQIAPGHPAPRENHRKECGGKIEIALPNGVRVKVAKLVSEKALSRVSRAVKDAA